MNHTVISDIHLLAATIVLSNRGWLRGQWVWIGMLDYMLYNYAFHLFGAAFNWFFLLYVALLGSLLSA